MPTDTQKPQSPKGTTKPTSQTPPPFRFDDFASL